MIPQTLLLLSLLSFTAATSSSPRVLFAANPLQIRQSGEETCLGSTCPDGSCAAIGYHCCSDGASCAAGTTCVKNGCCDIGDTCLGDGPGTTTLPGAITVPTLTGLSAAGLSAATGAAGGLTSLVGGTLNVNTLTSLNAYESFIKSAYATASGEEKSGLGDDKTLLSKQQSLLASSSGIIPAVLAKPTTTGGLMTGGAEESTSTTSTKAAPTSSSPTSSTPTSSTTSAAPSSQQTPATQAAGSGAERGMVSSVALAGAALAGLVVVMAAL